MKNGLNIYLSINLIILFLISSFRARFIGADYQTYINVFNRIRIVGMRYPYEKGYVFLNMLIGFFTDRYYWLGFSVNLIFFICFYCYIKRNINCKFYFFIIFIFIANPYLYLQSTFNILRQCCATGILLLSIDSLYKKKYIKYILIVIFAAQFHSMAYIFMLLIFVRIINWDKKIFYIISTLSFILNVFSKNDRLMFGLAKLFGYQSYIGYGKTEFDFLLYVIFILGVTLYLAFNYNFFYNNEKEKFFIDMYMIGLCFLPLLLKNDIAYRIYIILFYISLPALPIIWDAFKSRKKKFDYYILKWGYVLYYSLLSICFFYKMIKYNNYHYVPFVFFGGF